jgi:hypothetical protein
MGNLGTNEERLGFGNEIVWYNNGRQEGREGYWWWAHYDNGRELFHEGRKLASK